jgi:hypothetical protein
VAAALHNKNAAGWRQIAIRAQARIEDLMTRRHPEIEAMRNRFYDEDPQRMPAARPSESHSIGFLTPSCPIPT